MVIYNQYKVNTISNYKSINYYIHPLFQQNGSGSKGAIPKFTRGYERSVEFGNGDGCTSGKVPQGRTRTIGIGVETLQKAHKYPRDAQTVRNTSSSLPDSILDGERIYRERI